MAKITETLLLVGLGALAFLGIKKVGSDALGDITNFFKKVPNLIEKVPNLIDGADYNEDSGIIWGTPNVIDERQLPKPEGEGWTFGYDDNNNPFWSRETTTGQGEYDPNAVYPGAINRGTQEGYGGSGITENPYKTLTPSSTIRTTEEKLEAHRKAGIINDYTASNSKTWAEKDEEVKSLPEWKQEIYFRNRLANAGY